MPDFVQEHMSEQMPEPIVDRTYEARLGSAAQLRSPALFVVLCKSSVEQCQ